MQIKLQQGIRYTNGLRFKAYVARITGLDRDGFQGQFVPPVRVTRDSDRPRHIRTYTFSVTEPGLYVISAGGRQEFRVVTQDGKYLTYRIIADYQAAKIAMLLSQGEEFDSACYGIR